ncbi:MAG: ribonuclease E activity regulator RraA [Brachybacterium sp.]|nr:ribonuclease E activity regulator RraA [Brachybacterium sp.]MDN5901222.1 ribonuclease E activity regulator RraA [Brachybacterium sp.]
MTDTTATTDLHDEHGEALMTCDTQFRQFGARRRFRGEIVTVRSHEDNSLLKEIVREPGRGRVIVVDGNGSLHCAMLGDRMAATAQESGWAGMVVHGAVRDSAALAEIDLGIKALGTNPRRSHKHGLGERDVPVGFGGAVFTPGAILVSDEDGIVLLPAAG